jgi:hypothetical protein
MLESIKYLLLSSILVVSCSKSSGSDPAVTLPEGDYAVSGPICNSTEGEPDYPNANASALLYRFDNTEYTLNIAGNTATQTFQNESCKVTMLRELSTNLEGYFSMREKRTTASEPEDCNLSILHDDTTFNFSASHPSLASSDETKVELLFDVVVGDNGTYTLKTRNEEPELSVWRDFGCSNSDQIIYKLQKI